MTFLFFILILTILVYFVFSYRHSKLDEEIYKEFLEISKDQLSNMMKQCSTGINAHSLTRDPASYAQLLKFFDGICLWEESSTTPVLHILWAKCWISAIGKFEFTARQRVTILTDDEADESKPKSCDQPSPACDTTKDNQGQKGETKTDLNGNSKELNQSFAVHLKSFKMKGVKDLIQREKFNPAALTLQLTAQPTLAMSGTGKTSDSGTLIGTGARNRKSKTKDESVEEPSHSRAKRVKK